VSKQKLKNFLNFAPQKPVKYLNLTIKINKSN
jgi:hypothetical protein